MVGPTALGVATMTTTNPTWVPAEEIEPLSDLFARVLDGHNAYLTDGVELVLGRRPRDFADYAHDTAATGVWSPAAAGGLR